MRSIICGEDACSLIDAMFGKNLWVLLAVFIVLALLLTARVMLPKFQTQKSDYLEKTVLVQKNTVGNITLSKASEKVDILRDGDVWKVNGKTADKNKVGALLNFLLPENGFPEVVAQTDKQYHELEVTDQLATKTVVDNKLTFFIGKISGHGRYVRIDGSPNVYLVGFAPELLPTASAWYDTSVTAIDVSKITEISFQEPRSSMTISKKDTKWVRASDNAEAIQDKMDAVLFSLTNLRAKSIYDETTNVRYPSGSILSVNLKYDDKSETLEFFKGDSDYLLKRTSDGERFTIDESSISQILNASKELFPN